jgi:hypothetical protein
MVRFSKDLIILSQSERVARFPLNSPALHLLLRYPQSVNEDRREQVPGSKKIQITLSTRYEKLRKQELGMSSKS